jgi:hypothetical protein
MAKCDYCGKEIGAKDEVINVGEKNVCKCCFNKINTNESEDQDERAKNDKPQVYDKYPVLQFNISFQKIYGWLIVIISVICLLFSITKVNEYGGLMVLFPSLGGILLGAFAIAVGDLFQVVIDIEKNTRKQK